MPKDRGLTQHGGPPGWQEESNPAGVFGGLAVPPAFSIAYRLSCRSVISIILNDNLCSNLEQSMGDRNQVGIGLSYRACICKHFKGPRNRFSAWRAGTTSRAARLHRLGSINVYKYGLWPQAGGIDSLESIPGIHKCLKIVPSLWRNIVATVCVKVDVIKCHRV